MTSHDRDLVRTLAHAALTLAVRGRRERGGPWGEAVLAEFAETRGRWEAVRWAAGGLRAAWQERRGRSRHLPRFQRVSRRIALVTVLSLIAGLLINQFVLTVHYSPSGSMEPTVQVGDRWLVDKVGYRVSGIDRGDLVIHSKTYRDDGGDHQSEVIKRVIGLPGDTIDCRDGRVFRDGAAVDEPYLVGEPSESRTECSPVTVPPDTVYLLGDHRTVSQDSQQEGPVRTDAIVGRALFRVCC
jgi:signal peptidase I